VPVRVAWVFVECGSRGVGVALAVEEVGVDAEGDVEAESARCGHA